MRQDVLFHLSSSMVLARRSIQAELAAVTTSLCLRILHQSQVKHVRITIWEDSFAVCWQNERTPTRMFSALHQNNWGGFLTHGASQVQWPIFESLSACKLTLKWPCRKNSGTF